MNISGISGPSPVSAPDASRSEIQQLRRQVEQLKMAKSQAEKNGNADTVRELERQIKELEEQIKKLERQNSGAADTVRAQSRTASPLGQYLDLSV